jgi:DNA-binding IscR family transcriptional regulator
MDSRFSIAVEICAVLELEKSDSITSQEIATRLNTDPARVRQMFVLLGQAGIVKGQQGRGTWLAQPAEEISLADIFVAVRSEGTVISLTRPPPKDDQRRALGKLLQAHVLDGEAALIGRLDAVSLATLVRDFRKAAELF